MNMQSRSVVGIEKSLAGALRGILDQVDWLRGWRIQEADRATDADFDMHVTLPLPHGAEAGLRVAVKKELRPSEFRHFADRFSPSHSKSKMTVRVLGLPSVSARMAELCAEHGWSWFDLAGNCHLDVPGLFRIHRTGLPSLHRHPRPRANLGTPEAGRVIRALLHPDHYGRRWTQRYMVEHFGKMNKPIPQPSLGLVNKVVRYLREEAFIEELPNAGFQVRDPMKLLFSWRDAYRFDRHERRNCFTLLQGKRLREALAQLGAYSGGFSAYAAFSAAEIQAPHVRQPKTWLYVTEKEIPRFEEIVEAKPVESGENLVVLIPDDEGVFYLCDAGMTNENLMACTTPVQTYVDLWHCGGRGREAAEALLEQRLKPDWMAKGYTG